MSDEDEMPPQAFTLPGQITVTDFGHLTVPAMLGAQEPAFLPIMPHGFITETGPLLSPVPPLRRRSR
jgi:hypothetical protein